MWNPNLLSYEICSCHTKWCLIFLNTEKFHTSSSYTRNSQGGSFYVSPIFSILTAPFAFRHRSWFFFLFSPRVYISSVVVLLAVCASSSVACCLFKNWVWHFHGIWCLCDCIKRMCGLRQRWTGTNPAAALHWTAPCFPPTSADLGKCLQCSLKTCRLPHICCEWFPPPPVYSWLRTVKYNTFSDTLIFSYWEVVLFSYLKSWNGYAPLPPSPSSLRLFSHISQCKPTPALLVSSNWGKHYSRALYRQQFCWVIIVYVGCILGDWRISNKEFVTHFAEWTLWCPPCWILCLSSTSS